MAIAGDEAGIKASYFSTFSYSFLALIGIVPIISVDHLVAPGKETTQNLVHKQISQLLELHLKIHKLKSHFQIVLFHTR